jgi:broad specificity phosphatase PhoE
MALVTFTLVRHSESEANASLENKIGGHNLAANLTKNGEKQAEALGTHFKNESVVFTSAYSSTALRTQKTAEICLGTMGCKLPVFVDDQLLEQSAGGWEEPSRDIYNRSDVRQALDSDNWNYIPGDLVPGESQKMVAERMRRWVEKKVEELSTANENQHIVVFTHGLAIKFLLAVLLDLERSKAYCLPLDNASITQLCYRDRQIILPISKINYIGHLPDGKETETMVSQQKKAKADVDPMDKSSETPFNFTSDQEKEYKNALELFAAQYDRIRKSPADRYSDAGLMLDRDGVE